ncbi:MAG: 16S rRNA (guanine(966)-N(2))-methyltransferase RsmD [Xanthomonadales bacterium]|nr:16S rRNA (guanine(966)-N(2))-methyltransferase RsmD [Xanthomonadales bacterium]
MNRSARGGKPRAPGQVRIIGGDLRGSKLPVPVRDGLRPSSDRVRETLFNWLQPMLAGSRCLDLFAGSGALGFEAASRGAREVWMIEQDRELARSLAASAARLKVDGVRVLQADALQWLASRSDDLSQRFDLVFVDPPFAGDFWRPVLQHLDGWLSDSGWLYLESTRGSGIQPGSGWRQHRRGQTRDVDYALWQRQPGADASG